MKYSNIVQGTFISRPNRFIANVSINGETVVCHVKNTGRCRELLVPGTVVYLEHFTSSSRKTAYDLVAVEKSGKLINMDSQAPNKVFAEWAFHYLPDVKKVRTEVQYGQSRLDFCLETEHAFHFVEVKGATLEERGHVKFPDAPTERGVKHLHELIRAVQEGYEASIFFVVQMNGVDDFAPNDETHPEFGEALRQAERAGVHVAAYSCRVTPDSVEIDAPVKIVL